MYQRKRKREGVFQSERERDRARERKIERERESKFAEKIRNFPFPETKNKSDLHSGQQPT